MSAWSEERQPIIGVVAEVGPTYSGGNYDLKIRLPSGNVIDAPAEHCRRIPGKDKFPLSCFDLDRASLKERLLKLSTETGWGLEKGLLFRKGNYTLEEIEILANLLFTEREKELLQNGGNPLEVHWARFNFEKRQRITERIALMRGERDLKVLPVP
jgi:hypothetical protein